MNFKNRFFKLLLVLSVFVVSEKLNAQERHTVQGRINDQKNEKPAAYAHIYNSDLRLGTISNASGAFQIKISDFSDSVVVSFVGYQPQTISLEPGKSNYLIQLKPAAHELSTVTVKPEDDDYLYDLLTACRENDSKITAQAKGYYELKTYKDSNQIELVEGFYNLKSEGYDLTSARLKTGRAALQKSDNVVFASLESSKAVAMIKTFEESSYFPVSPLPLSKRKMKKQFYLQFEKAYENEDSDSVFVIEFTPKDTASTEYFSGKIWVNRTHRNLIKTKLQARNTTQHPFIAIKEEDQVTSTDLNITKYFTKTDSGSLFRQTDFDYAVHYQNPKNHRSYSIQTSAVLFAYDFENLFSLPLPEDLFRNDPDDYTLISSLPYFEGFWSSGAESKLIDVDDANSSFFSNPASLSSRSLRQSKAVADLVLTEKIYEPWSKSRFNYQKALDKGDEPKPYFKDREFIADQYNLKAHIALDYYDADNEVKHVTRTLFDLKDSYYDLTFDRPVHCFLNMYFDLYEIGRRELEKRIAELNEPAPETVKKVYREVAAETDKTARRFVDEVDRGYNEQAMERWNEHIELELKIDNLNIFQPYSSRK